VKKPEAEDFSQRHGGHEGHGRRGRKEERGRGKRRRFV